MPRVQKGIYQENVKNGSEILKKALEMISRAFLYFKILESVLIGIDKRKEKKYDFKCE